MSTIQEGNALIGDNRPWPTTRIVRRHHQAAPDRALTGAILADVTLADAGTDDGTMESA